jgi:hypothetical protein
MITIGGNVTNMKKRPPTFTEESSMVSWKDLNLTHIVEIVMLL